MIALLQRVAHARVLVNEKRLLAGAQEPEDERPQDEVIGAIGHGLLVFVGVERGDGPQQASRLGERIHSYRMFADEDGRMNLDVRQSQGEILLVPQFTLAANTDKGKRASFTSAATPEMGRRLFDQLVSGVEKSGVRVATGRFGAHMQVELVNDGPVTFWLRVKPPP